MSLLLLCLCEMGWPPFINGATHAGSGSHDSNLWRDLSVRVMCACSNVMREVIGLKNRGVGRMLEAEVALCIADMACTKLDKH
jgi:hypothetical protein